MGDGGSSSFLDLFPDDGVEDFCFFLLDWRENFIHDI